ncbi:holo-[acyl-carrier-protein] synthase AcpS [Clostridium aceticum]|uniref:Holo-[acyl-carrier-protein] synthase n=1 Tax=Clostridium aceticum TaxID=84022 RepID=A0A0D8IEN0_9CLOT|nr:holo-ACP synthase [Clostridium aceticum]AKL96766.1 holo-[acyl-carrier-protein] synthase AcpS [Clostridium aceticum]KJF27661.1 ACP synthase [Clostridium aceticum]
MIKGLGIDIIEIHRIEEAVRRNPRFLKRVFTQEEIILFEERSNHPSTIAGFFAAKEATVKALGTGIRGLAWCDIEVKKDALGKPLIKLHNNALKVAYSKDIKEIWISISHSRLYAVAQAIAL